MNLDLCHILKSLVHPSAGGVVTAFGEIYLSSFCPGFLQLFLMREIQMNKRSHWHQFELRLNFLFFVDTCHSLNRLVHIQLRKGLQLTEFEGKGDFTHMNKMFSVFQRGKNMGQKYGQLSREDIIKELKDGKLVIEPRLDDPEDDTNIKTASFDISPSCLIMSVKRGSFMRIYSRISHCAKGHRNPEWHCAACRKSQKSLPHCSDLCSEQLYVYIEPRDTALVLSREYLQLPANICGNVFSRVSTVSSGLGHISTTIDPLWKGALLIAISNPSSEPVPLIIKDGASQNIPLATVTLQYLNSPVDPSAVHSTHLPARVDILERYLYSVEESKNKGILFKKFVYRFLHTKDHNLTVRLIDDLKNQKDIDPSLWADYLETLEKQVCAQKIRRNTWRYWLVDHLRWIGKLLMVAGLFAIVLLTYSVLTKDSISTNDLLGAMIITVLECTAAIILN